jgi:SAM-dependent MidA family methyltransferase
MVNGTKNKPPATSANAGDLPALGPEALAHSRQLEQAIREEIKAAGGAIPFARFMELALYAPGLGYYSAGALKFGAGGDFVTAPELSSVFGRCLARQCRQVLDRTGGDILEFGAGSGALAADILKELERLGTLPERYWILEVSPDLRQRQQQTLQERAPGLRSRVQWLDRLPEQFHGVVLANEVLDAMPVHRFRIEQDGIHELQVAWGNDHFQWASAVATGRLRQRVEQLQDELGEPFAEGYTSEISLAHGPWINAVAQTLESGAVLLVDYGYPASEYYHPQRSAGTLMCHYRHRAHPDPFRWVGLQDITAYVDFTAVAEAAAACDLSVAGFTTQAHFLMGSGLGEIMAESDPADTQGHLELARQVKLLTLPGEMGERFKVLALTRGLTAPLMGFAVQDQRARL